MAPKPCLTGISVTGRAIVQPSHHRLARLLLGGLSLALLSACQPPTTQSSATPEAQQQHPTKITAQIQQSLEQSLDELLRDRFPATGPGAAVLIIYNNQILYAQGHGLSNVEQKQPVTAETVFDLASVSKSMTALAILQLQERGALSLDDPVVNHLPDFKDPDPNDPVLIAHLMHHTSGLVDYLEVWDLENEAEALQEFDLAQLLPWLSQQSVQAKPGTDFSYSDTGYALLALIVQQVSGQPFPEFMAENIFTPAGMTQTQIYQILGETFPKQAQGYQVEQKQGQGQEQGQIKVVAYPVLMVGDGNVFTSLVDLARYDQALRQGTLVSSSTNDLAFQDGMLSDGSTIGDQEGEGYGAGWSLTENYAHHQGGWAGMSSYYRFYTQQPLSIIVLANREGLDSQELGEAIASILAEHLSPGF